jgi:hypothetical protein
MRDIDETLIDFSDEGRLRGAPSYKAFMAFLRRSTKSLKKNNK